MRYAQIKDLKVKNIIKLDDLSLLPQFLEGFDFLKPLADDGSESIGDVYDPGSEVISKPLAPVFSLPITKQIKIVEGSEVLKAFIDTRYEISERLRLLTLGFFASKEDRPNQFVYIKQMKDWADSIQLSFIAQVNLILAMTTVADVNAKVWNFSEFIATDPKVTSLAAVLIID